MRAISSVRAERRKFDENGVFLYTGVLCGAVSMKAAFVVVETFFYCGLAEN
jgi:hypothetical protein